MDKWGCNNLIELKTLWEKEKLLVTSNFSFSQNVSKSCLLLMRQNEYLWSRGLKGKEADKACVLNSFSKPQTFRPVKNGKYLQTKK